MLSPNKKQSVETTAGCFFMEIIDKTKNFCYTSIALLILEVKNDFCINNHY
jgi:hypothetical protein